jgi:hypothetical protein
METIEERMQVLGEEIKRVMNSKAEVKSKDVSHLIHELRDLLTEGTDNIAKFQTDKAVKFKSITGLKFDCYSIQDLDNRYKAIGVVYNGKGIEFARTKGKIE